MGGLNSESKQAVRTSFIYNAGGGGSPSALAACSSSSSTYTCTSPCTNLLAVKECSADAFIHAPCVWSPASAYSGGFPFERVCLHRMYGQPWGFEAGAERIASNASLKTRRDRWKLHAPRVENTQFKLGREKNEGNLYVRGYE